MKNIILYKFKNIVIPYSLSNLKIIKETVKEYSERGKELVKEEFTKKAREVKE